MMPNSIFWQTCVYLDEPGLETSLCLKEQSLPVFSGGLDSLSSAGVSEVSSFGVLSSGGELLCGISSGGLSETRMFELFDRQVRLRSQWED